MVGQEMGRTGRVEQSPGGVGNIRSNASECESEKEYLVGPREIQRYSKYMSLHLITHTLPRTSYTLDISISEFS